MELQSRTKEWIVRNNLNNEQVAEALQVSKETVSKWNNSKAFPSLHKSFELAELFNCTVDELYTKKKAPSRRD